MKTLKQLLEFKKPSPTVPFEKDSETSLTPKAPDEKRFKDKHVVDVKQDIAGNKDDVYKATNVQAYDRKASRHGNDDASGIATYESVEMKTLSQILGERHMTPAEMKKREKIALGIEKSNPGISMEKKMRIATAKAMGEEVINESESSAAAYERHVVACTKSMDDISKAIGQHVKHVNTKSDWHSGEPQWHHADHMKNMHRTLQDIHQSLQQTNDYTAPPKTKQMKESLELFDVFAEELHEDLQTVFESLDETNQQLMIEMIETGEYDAVVEIVKEIVNE